MSEFSIKAVAQATGLTVETLRAWERRYEAVVPKRDGTGRRGYSAADVARLRLLRSATELGHPISRVARLPPDHLAKLVNDAGGQVRTVARGQTYVVKAIDAAEHSDAPGVEEALLSAFALLPPREVANNVIAPLVTEIGERWHRGEISIAQEHMVTEILRRLVGNAARSYYVDDSAPCLVLTTLSGERHDLGILLCNWLAATRRCRTHYLGADTPVDDIVRFALEVEADAVLISMVMPEDHVPAMTTLRDLTGRLARRCQVWVGGQAARFMSVEDVPDGAVFLPTLSDFEQRLDLMAVR